MQILGLEPIVMSLIVTAIGGVLQLFLGYLASGTEFNWKKAASTAIVTLVVGIPVVATAFNTLEEGTSDLTILIVILGLIATISGIDGLKNSIAKAISNRK